MSDDVQNVLNRMRDAAENRTGIKISADEIQSLKCSIFGEIWSQPDPRTREGVAWSKEQYKRSNDGN